MAIGFDDAPKPDGDAETWRGFPGPGRLSDWNLSQSFSVISKPEVEFTVPERDHRCGTD